jgi:uncharacterized protein DUF6309
MAPLSTEAVIDAVLEERAGRAGSWPWTERLIRAAAAGSSDDWHEVQLDAAAAFAVMLPAHAGEPCKGDRLMLVPESGIDVRGAVEAFRALGDDYARDNPTCWGRIMRAAQGPFSTIVLKRSDSRLHHVDGFHRLIGWGWAGRLTGQARITAFVTGRRH